MDGWKQAAQKRIANDQGVQEALAVEPRLQKIFDAVLALQPRRPGYCRHRSYGAVKRMVSRLVGFYAVQPEIATPYHYVAVVQCVYDILPDDERDGAIADAAALRN